MRKLALGLAALAALAFLAAAPASAAGLGIHASYWTSDEVDDMLGGGLSLAFPLGDSGLDLELRGTYYEEGDIDNVGLDDDETDPGDVFDVASIEALPVEAGLRWNFAPTGPANLYIAGGGSYVFLDHDLQGVEIDDEVGWYGLFGARFGDPEGVNFFVEGLYRGIEATLEDDPDSIGDLDDLDLEEGVDVNLDGFAANVGVVFGF